MSATIFSYAERRKFLSNGEKTEKGRTGSETGREMGEVIAFGQNMKRDMTGSSEGWGALRRKSQKLFPDGSRSRESRKNAQACKLLGAIGLGARVQVGLSPPGFGGHVPVSLSKFLRSSSY